MEDDEDDSEFLTANKQSITGIHQVKYTAQNVQWDKYTKQDIQRMCMMSSQIIRDIAEINENLILNDIKLTNSEGKHYEYSPF